MSSCITSLTAAVATALQPLHAIALPTGGQIVAGDVTTTINGAQMTLDQASRTAIMNWQSFNIAPNELVRILQSGTDAAMLARVTGGNPSELLGRLQADGKVFLINPRGVLVGPGAMIDTAAFMASTLDVADADFLAQGALTFKGDSDAGIVNLGKITAHEGNVILLAHTVKNDGELAAPRGSVGLGAGSEVYLASPNAPTFVIKANLASAGSGVVGVHNEGVITAAQAQLEAAGGSIYDLAVNQSGVVHANGVERRPDGRILITADSGNVSVSGTAIARDADGSGGEILVGGDYQGSNAAIANASRTYVGANASLDANASASIGDGGRIIVWGDEATAFLGSLEARAGQQGGNGGFAEVSGKHSLAFHGTADLSAPAGKRGELLLDPDNITIVAGETPLPDALTGVPYTWFEADDPGDQTLGADSLANLLANASVTLNASDTLTVNAPVVVAAGGADSVRLSLYASTLAINEDVSLANVTGGSLHLNHLGLGSGSSLTTAPGATLAAEHIRIDGFPIVALNGPVSADRLTYASLGPVTSLIATHLNNTIRELTIVSDEADPQPVSFSGNVFVHSDAPMSVGALIGAANNVTLSSSGDLTLRGESLDLPGTVINASGETKLASTGGVLINQAGADVLAGTGRRLLYTSNTTGAFTLGGLSGFTQFDGVGFPDDPHSLVTLVLYNAAGTGPVLTLTITANDFIRLYGQPNPTFTASFSGGTSADLTVQPTFTILGGPAVNVGTYTIVPSGAASNTHNIEYVNGTLTINPAVLTYVANPFSRLYGDANPVFGGTVTGFVNGDTLESATTGALMFSSSATELTDAGAWSIFGSGLIANHDNYIFEQAFSNLSALTINPAPLTVTIQDATRMYGAANPQFSATVTGFRNGDTLEDLTGFSLGSQTSRFSSVGEYAISARTDATNYVLNVVPGTLTITPAPLTLQGLTLSSVFGNAPPALGYQVHGLLNNDRPDVLSGVTFDTLFTTAAAPGTYSYGFGSTGFAQNYVVTDVIPGTMTIERLPIIGRVNDASSAFGAAPASFAATFTPPPFGAPQFTITGELRETAERPGRYVLTPVIQPSGAATAEDLARYYTFDVQPGTLTLNYASVDPAAFQQLIVVNGPESEISLEEARDNATNLIEHEEQKVKVVHNINGTQPMSAQGIAGAAADFGPDLIALIPDLLASDAVKEFSPEQLAFLEQLREGGFSPDALEKHIASDPAARAAIMPLLSRATLSALESGKPLTLSQQALVARISNNINEQRQMLAQELKQQLFEFEMLQAKVSKNNPFAFKTMPDIAVSAQQAVTERIIGAAAGAAVGAAIGAGAAAALHFSGAVVGHTYAVVNGVVKSVGAVTAGAGAATAIIGVAVSLVVIGVQAAIMVAQEEQNKNAYDAMMNRATTGVDKNLGGLDLKNDALAKAEFMTAFTKAMLESGSGAVQ
nr:MBG domain-containing protein [uncultured Steroidobacter sp.]